MSLRARVHEYLEKTPTSAGPRAVQVAIMGLILLNVAAVVVGTVPVETGGANLEDRHQEFFGILEWISVGVFTAEYVLRVWSITADPRHAHPLWGRVRFALTPLALVDLLSILPTYAEALGVLHGADGRVIRALRLVRVFRLFKLGHYSGAVRTLGRVFHARRAELAVTIFIMLLTLVIISSVVYHVENAAQPDKFSSIPATMWWGIVTLTTVGYGDISPVTSLGKFLGGVGAVFGIGLVALPTAILGSAFVEALKEDQEPRRCPHCGKKLS